EAISRRRRVGRADTVSWCAAARAAAARCFAHAGRAADVASGFSRDREAPRLGCRAPAAAQGRLRAPAAPGRAQDGRGLYVLSDCPGKRRTAPGVARVAQALPEGGGAQPD